MSVPVFANNKYPPDDSDEYFALYVPVTPLADVASKISELRPIRGFNVLFAKSAFV